MYFPYFRGKQFELIALRESAQLMSRSGIEPIIEPVKEALRGLERTLKEISAVQGRVTVIVNPYHGDYQEDGSGLSNLLLEQYKGDPAVSAGILLRGDTKLEEALALQNQHVDNMPTFIHAGFGAHKELAAYCRDPANTARHVFIEEHANTLYRKAFNGSTRILLKDGFKRRKNAEYAAVPIEVFSELHLTYESDLGMTGFGDFSIVGDNYSEAGGPAYAVAIHLTFFDAEKDNVMYVHHFVSTTNDTPTDPAGKFSQALSKLMDELGSPNSKLPETQAIQEFRELHRNRHFPGLGFVKKLSMSHHLEAITQFLGAR